MLMDLSDYELERLKKIAENKRMLVALGLETEAEQKPACMPGMPPTLAVGIPSLRGVRPSRSHAVPRMSTEI